MLCFFWAPIRNHDRLKISSNLKNQLFVFFLNSGYLRKKLLFFHWIEPNFNLVGFHWIFWIKYILLLILSSFIAVYSNALKSIDRIIFTSFTSWTTWNLLLPNFNHFFIFSVIVLVHWGMLGKQKWTNYTMYLILLVHHFFFGLRRKRKLKFRNCIVS